MSVGGFREVERELDKLERDIHRRAVATMDLIAHHLANDAKTHHEWGNPYSEGYEPTGHTDQSTIGGIEKETREFVRAAFSVGTHYSVFLELAMQGRWAWLWKTVIRNQAWIVQQIEQGLQI